MAGKDSITKVERKLLRRVGKAIRDYSLIQDGDRVLVAMSGGKDSYALLVLLEGVDQRVLLGSGRGARRRCQVGVAV